MYITNKTSIRQIAKICNVSSDTIRTRLEKFSISIRNHKESNVISGASYSRRKSTQEEKYSRIEKLRTGLNIECLNCGKEFYVPKCRLNSTKYCSIYCFYQYKREHVDRNQDWRDYPEYDEWRKLVYKRDGWKCMICGSKEKINAHHIFEAINFEELRFDVNNGITICEKHHIKLHKYTSSFIQECIKQTSNIGGTPEVDNPEASIKEYLFSLIRSNDYQEES